MSPAIKVLLFHDFPKKIDIPGYEIRVCNPFATIEPGRHFAITDFIAGGRESYFFMGRVYSAAGIDRLYRQRDPTYVRLAMQLVEEAQNCDIVVLANYNPLHPEILSHELKKPIKILGLIDDPSSSYVRGIPYLWAFDGAFYISPSYDERSLFQDKIREWGVRHSMWWPLVPHPFPRVDPTEAFFRDRDVDLLYVGNAYGAKIDRLVQLKRRFGKRFRIHGRWPLGGYHGMVRGMLGKPILWDRVRFVTSGERRQLYMRTKIGINMHLSEIPRETGNMRMYEVPAHGAMLVCDKAGRDAHQRIFDPGNEAIYYENIDDAIAKIEFYLSHEDERIKIAERGYHRFWSDYEWGKNLKRLLDWAWQLRFKRVELQ